jgi:hypothetical protein
MKNTRVRCKPPSPVRDGQAHKTGGLNKGDFCRWSLCIVEPAWRKEDEEVLEI